MINWYVIFNMADLPELVTSQIVIELEGIGEKTILVTQGNHLGLTVDEVFLSLGSAGVEDYAEMNGLYATKDEDGNVWLGYDAE